MNYPEHNSAQSKIDYDEIVYYNKKLKQTFDIDFVKQLASLFKYEYISCDISQELLYFINNLKDNKVYVDNLTFDIIIFLPNNRKILDEIVKSEIKLYFVPVSVENFVNTLSNDITGTFSKLFLRYIDDYNAKRRLILLYIDRKYHFSKNDIEEILSDVDVEEITNYGLVFNSMIFDMNSHVASSLIKNGIIVKEMKGITSNEEIIDCLVKQCNGKPIRKIRGKTIYQKTVLDEDKDYFVNTLTKFDIKIDDQLLSKICKNTGRNSVNMMDNIFKNSDLIPNSSQFDEILNKKITKERLNILTCMIKRLENKRVINKMSGINNPIDILRELCKTRKYTYSTYGDTGARTFEIPEFTVEYFDGDTPTKRIPKIQEYIEKKKILPDNVCLNNAMKDWNYPLVNLLMDKYNVKPDVDFFKSMVYLNNPEMIDIMVKACGKFNIPTYEDERSYLIEQMHLYIRKSKKNFVEFLNDHKLEPDIICLRGACISKKIDIVEEIIDNYGVDIDVICFVPLYCLFLFVYNCIT